MLKELREEVVLNVLLNNESEFEEYCKEKCDFNCLSSNIDYIYHLLDKAEIKIKIKCFQIMKLHRITLKQVRIFLFK